MNNNEVAKVLDTILSIPGMNDQVKIDLKISRRHALMLAAAIDHGLTNSTDLPPVLDGITKDNSEVLQGIGQECLQKAGLTELSEKLRTLSK